MIKLISNKIKDHQRKQKEIKATSDLSAISQLDTQYKWELTQTKIKYNKAKQTFITLQNRKKQRLPYLHSKKIVPEQLPYDYRYSLKNKEFRKSCKDHTLDQNRQNLLKKIQREQNRFPLQQVIFHQNQQRSQEEWQAIKSLIKQRQISSKSLKIIIRKNKPMEQISTNRLPFLVKSWNKQVHCKTSINLQNKQQF